MWTASIQQVLGTHGGKGFDASLPAPRDDGWIFISLDRSKRWSRPEQGQHVLNGKHLGMESMQGDSKLHAQPRGIQRLPIQEHDANSLAALAGVAVRVRREDCRLEANAGNPAAFEI